MKTNPLYWVSLVTGNKYLYSEYSNIETPKYGFSPLPKDEYPYTIEYNHLTMFQEVKQTDSELMAMYMKLPKKEIIKMLIEANKVLNRRAALPKLYTIDGKPIKGF